MKRSAIEKATSANHPLRTTEVFDGAKLDDDTLKRLYGLKQRQKVIPIFLMKFMWFSCFSVKNRNNFIIGIITNPFLIGVFVLQNPYLEYFLLPAYCDLNSLLPYISSQPSISSRFPS